MSKSLGTLTLDLIARIGGFTGPMDKAARQTKKNTKEISSAIAGVAKATAAMTVAAGGAITAFILKAEEAEGRLSDLAGASGIARDEFRSLAYAFSTVGVSQEQLASMSVKVTKSLGEFMQTGKGPLADVFTVLAGKVDLTAESLRGLSGPEVLQKVKDSMDQANVPIEQQVLLLDKISKGAGKLVPLLKDQGAAVNQLTSDFEKYNSALLLTDEQSAEFGEVGDKLDLLMTTISNAGIYLSAYFGPELGAAMDFMSEKISRAAEYWAEFFDSFREVTDMRDIDNLNQKLSETTEEYNRLNEALKTFDSKEANTRFYNPDLFEARKKTLQDQLDETKRIIAEINSQIEKVKTEKIKPPKPVSKYSSGTSIADIDERAKADEKAAKERAKFAEEMAEIAADEMYLINELDREREESRQKQREDMAALQKEAYYYLDVLSMQGLSSLEMIDQQERLKLDKLREYANQGLIDYTDFENAKTAVLEQSLKEREQLQLQQDLLMLTAGEQFFGAMASLQAQFGDDQGNAYKVLFAISKGFAIARGALSLASAISSASETGITPAEKFANMAAVAAAVGQVVSSISSINYTGMAHDGIDSVPQTGTWLLQKGERVTTAQTSAKLDATLDEIKGGGSPDITVINQTSGRIDKVQQQQTDDGRIVLIVQEVLEGELMNPNSRANKALNRTRNAPRKF